MDRIIEVKVGGNHLKKDSKNAGVRGEANVANLRITFDSGWDEYTKKVTFWDSRGGNPVVRTLTIDLLENITKSKRIYLVPIPAEPMAEAGMLTYVIDGYIDGKRQRSISDQLEVKDAPIADNAGEPADPTPTQAEQLQGQLDLIIDTIQDAYHAHLNARESADEAKESEEKAKVSEISAKGYALLAETHANDAQSAVGKVSYIGANGNWFAWDDETKAFYDTMVKAQAGSTVYVGDNPPDDADVWIDPDGESALYAPYIGENGNWYTFNPETQTFTDSGHTASPETVEAKVIEFSNGVKIIKSTVIPSGLSLSYGGQESLIYDGESNVFMADHDGNGDHIPTTYATKKELQAPKEVIEFANNPLGEMKFVSDKDGLKLVWDCIYGKAEYQIASWESDVVLSTHAELAYRADADELGRNIRLTYATKEELQEHFQKDFASLVERTDSLEQSVEILAGLTDEKTTPFASKEEVGDINAALLEIIAIQEEMLIPDGNEVDY